MDDKSCHSEVVEMHAIVRGRVQGVFFRATTQKYAKKLGIKGTVKNKTDGTVDIVAQGRKEELDTLMQLLQSDSGPGYVDSMTTEFMKPTHVYNDFRIIFHH